MPAVARLTSQLARRAPWIVIGLVALATWLISIEPQLVIGENRGFLPAFLAAIVLCDALTGVVLVALYATGGSPRLLALSWAYAYSSTVVTVHALVFPGVFTDGDLLGAVASSAPWLWTAWHVGFPALLTIGLVPWPDGFARLMSGHRRTTAVTSHLLVLGGALAVAAAATLFSHHLPTIMVDGSYATLTHVYGPAILALQVGAVIAALQRARVGSGLETWALVAVVASACDASLVILAEGRWTLGWYGARALTLLAAVVVLVSLLTEAIRAQQRIRTDTERLRAHNAELREAQGLRDHMIAVVTHDMRTPIGGLTGYLELMDDGDLGDLPRPAEKAVHRSQVLARRLSLLTEDLLMVATGAGANLSIDLREVDLPAEARAAAAGFPDRDIRVTEPLALVTGDRPVRVRADPLRLQQVLENLLINAFKYGEPPVVITVRAEGDDGVIEVADHGPGVPEEFVPRLFDRYSRAAGVTANGSGLGLSVVADIVAAHHGSVGYVLERKAFAIRLPLVQPLLGGPAAPVTEASVPAVPAGTTVEPRTVSAPVAAPTAAPVATPAATPAAAPTVVPTTAPAVVPEVEAALVED
ncbi:sensor histidine kinase [Nocardioides bruguierae]|uniref:histidine kinase n=1 Tax=Nocardioides bruguierae TaxID=2945102 RepID=A0A9X2IGQ0_9ACTN|nr:MASE4 domain-containing protein [Nocardioides bruguierae]MCM0621804.1 MASE4 domain-containing protein [Nocardioides bruguierae]